MSRHIFISYKHEESSLHLAYELKKQLNRRDISVWFDKDIPGGSLWSEEIDLKIETCALMIVIITPAAVNAEYVTYEWAYALGLQKTVIPVLLEGSESILHARLARLQYRDFRIRFKEEWENLFEDIDNAMEMLASKSHSDTESGGLHTAVRRITSHLLYQSSNNHSALPNTWDAKMLRTFLELAPPKIVNHLSAADLLVKDFDETSGFKTLFSRLFEIHDFAQIELLHTMNDKKLAQLLLDACDTILYFNHNQLDNEDDIFIDFDSLGADQNAIFRLREAYKALISYVRKRYPDFQFSPRA